MIPVKLTLHNFLSYRDATLEFSGFDLAVLSGNNGVGKSSLLEAITWCVWEQARAASTDDLIHQGENAMWVEYVFEHEGVLYRIVRRRQKRARGGETTLEFQIKPGLLPVNTPGVLSEWRSLTEGTIRQTQDKIIKTLRLPYEIFVNSSYLRQGHADEFTVKTPAQRKAILAEILGLTLYDILEERAREKKRHSESRVELIQLQVVELKQQLAYGPTIETRLAEITKTHKDTRATLAIATKNLEKLNDERLAYEKIHQQLELERTHFTTLQDELKRVMVLKDDTTRDIKTLAATLGNRAAIEANVRELALAKKELDNLTHTMMVSRKLTEQLAVGESRKADLEHTIERLTTLDECPTCLRTLTKAEIKRIIDDQTKTFEQSTGGTIKTLKEKIGKLGYSREQFVAMRERVRALEPFQAHHEELKLAQAKIEEKKRIIEELERQVVSGSKQLARITTSGRTLKLELARYAHAQKQYQEEKTRIDVLQPKAAETQRRLGALQEQMKQIKEQHTRHKALEKELKVHGFSAEQILEMLEAPPSKELGDIAFPVFKLATK
ncbi:AAA family ATPase [Candidatus Berkelbacteria bacterium]|nr:AAA family ATPase [Candidatus Berkelbacteria bacterium]